MRKTTGRKRLFSLLEIVVVLVLISLMAGVVGVRMGKGFEERRFELSVGRLRAELESAHRLAINMQADWILTLTREKNVFRLQRSAPELGRNETVEWDAVSQIFFNDEEMQCVGRVKRGVLTQIVFDFSSTGKISPKGSIELVQGKNQVHWQLPELLGQTEE